MAQIKSYDTLTDLRNHVKEGRLLSKGAELTIDATAESITVTDSYHLVDTAADASSDDLKTINGGAQAGQLLILQAANDARTVVLKAYASGDDNIKMAADVTLAEATDTATLIYNGTDWNLLSSATGSTPS